jgi:hypothetical protein
VESYQPAHPSASRKPFEVGGSMCPACVASTAAVLGSTVSTGGLTALVVTVLRKKRREKNDSKEREKE